MRRLVLSAFLSAAVASSALLPSVAHADDAAVVEAKARFEEGLGLADAGQHEAARIKFQQAYAVFKSATVLFNLARTEQVTGHELEALEHFRLFVRVSTTDAKINDAMRDKAKQNVAELSRKVGQVDIDAPPASHIAVDGRSLDEVPKEPVAVSPGRHTIEATFQGKVKSVSVECGAGSVVKAKIEFESGTTEPPPVAPTNAWTPARIATVSGLGALAVTGVVLGFVFHASASSKVDQARAVLDGGGYGCLDAPPGDAKCAQARSLQSDRDRAVTLSTVFFVSGAVLAAGSVGAALLWPQRTKESAQLLPAVGPGFAGASLGGRF